MDIDTLLKEIREIKEICLRTEKEVQELKVICSRMDGHITFVEKTYEKFKYPLDLIKSKVETTFKSLGN